MLRELFNKNPKTKPKQKQLIIPPDYNSVMVEEVSNPLKYNEGTNGSVKNKIGLTVPNLTTATSSNYSTGENMTQIGQNKMIKDKQNIQNLNYGITMSGKGISPAQINLNQNEISLTSNNKDNDYYSAQNPKSNENYEHLPEKLPTSPSINRSHVSYSSHKTSKKGIKSLNQTAASITYEDKLNMLQNFISDIKSHKTSKKTILEKKEMKKNKLQTNVEILKNNIRSIIKAKKYNTRSNREILNENDRLINMGERAYEQSNYIVRELPLLRTEIDEMKKQMDQCNQTTQMYRNEFIECDRNLLSLKDEIKKKNTAISNLMKEKEKIQNDLIIIQKKIQYLNDKIKGIEIGSNEFMNSVALLYKESDQNFQENFSKAI